jgi:putative oxidoreductase
MTDTTLAAAERGTNPLLRVVGAINASFARIPTWIPLLVLRLTVAIPFWKSGLTKWDGFLQVSPSANYLFANEFKLHLFGADVAYPAPELMAFLSGVGEMVLPVMLVLGLGTRFAAFGLLIMTGIIQLTLPDAWQNFHLPWAAMLLPILVYGPGAASIDRWLLRDRA